MDMLIVLIFSLFLTGIFIFITVNKTINYGSYDDVIHYLNSLHRSTPSQIKGEISKTYSYGLIKNLKNMKKVIQAAIALLIVVLTGITLIVFVESKSYFKRIFEIEKNKIELRTEESADSLIYIIERQQKIIDSVVIVNSGLNENVDLLKNNLNQSNNQIIEKNKVIKNFEKQIKDLDAIIAY